MTYTVQAKDEDKHIYSIAIVGNLKEPQNTGALESTILDIIHKDKYVPHIILTFAAEKTHWTTESLKPLLGAYKLLNLRNRKLVIVNPPEKLDKMLTITGIKERVPVYSSESLAIEYLQQWYQP